MTLNVHISLWLGEPQDFKVQAGQLTFTDRSVFVGQQQKFYFSDVREILVKPENQPAADGRR